VAAGLLALYGAVVALAVFWPTPIDRDYQGAIVRVLSVVHRHGIPEWFGYRALEFSANVTMFVPLGFLVFFVLPRRRWWLALVLCPGLSIAIELTQGMLLAQRFATLSDVVANSLGAAVGVLLALGIRAIVNRRDGRMLAQRA
jgi:glycopeptide antibiotics resistance protein